MGKLVISEFLSLDGVMDTPSWTAPYWNDGIAAFKAAEMEAAQALLQGRVTYDGMATAWPERGDEDPGAATMNAIPKYVVSTTLTDATWNNSTIIRENVVQEVQALKDRYEGDVLVYGVPFSAGAQAGRWAEPARLPGGAGPGQAPVRRWSRAGPDTDRLAHVQLRRGTAPVRHRPLMGTALLSMFMSLDGFVNDPQGRVGPLYPDPAAFDQTAFMQDSVRTTGSVVMGRRAFDMGKPDGYVGQYEYQVPIFVLTHHPPAVPPKQDERLTFTFVDSIREAVTQAKVAAGDRDVLIIGGADTAQQALNAGVVDELEVGVAPVLLGGGTPLFGTLLQSVRLKRLSMTDLSGTAILRYRIVR